MVDSQPSSPPSSPAAFSAVPPPPSGLLPTFPPEFLTFLEHNSLSPTHYSRLLLSALSSPSAHSGKPTVPSRFIHPTSPSSSLPLPTPSEIAASLNLAPEQVTPVRWLPSSGALHFLRLPGATPIAQSDHYKSGQLQALDAASAVSVLALDLQPDDHVLDLCCAPGGKLALCAEAVKGGRGTVTGVDLSQDRMFVTKTLMRKLGLGGKTRSFVGDGRAFDLGVGRFEKMWRGKEFGEGVEAEMDRDEREDAQWKGWERGGVETCWVGVGEEEGEGKVPSRVVKTMVVPSRFEKSAQGKGPQSEVWVPYDKVLVDAECTHDGSISHLLKYLTLTPSTSPQTPPTFTFPPALLTSLLSSLPSPTIPNSPPTTHSPLSNLQLSLLLNGFRLLRPGGILVYSTCSLSTMQGEEVVERFLTIINSNNDAGGAEGEAGARGKRAEVEDVPGREEMPCEERDGRYLGGQAVRFGGGLKEGREEDWVSGLFVCRVRKIW